MAPSEAPTFGPVTHLIFDMDGLILDTEKFYTEVSQEIAQRYGKEFTWEIKAKQMGQRAIESARVYVKELDIADQLTPEQYLRDREEGLDRLFPTAELLPGAEELLRYRHTNSIPFALATSSNKRHFEMKTSKHAKLFSLFNHIVTGDDVSRGKPHPDIFHKAASLFDPTPLPSTCLVFEDAPSGVKAALAAGMYCVAVPDPNLDSALVSDAHQVLSSLKEFNAVQWGLPQA